MVQRRDQLKRGREKERRREMAKLRRRKGQTRRSREGRQPTDWAGFGEGRFGVWSWESERRSGSCRGAFVDSDRTERGGSPTMDPATLKKTSADLFELLTHVRQPYQSMTK